MNTSPVNFAIDAWKSQLTKQDQLISTLRNQNLLTMGAALVNYIGQTRIVQEIGKQSDHQIDAARRNAESLIKSVQLSTDEITKHIHQLGVLLDGRLSVIEDQLRIGVLLTKNVAALLRIPNFQKERQYFLEQGLKHYYNARLDDTLYAFALENLLKAEEREKTDYVVLHRIGMIYLYSPTEFDVTKAEAYFQRAAKFAAVEANDAAVRLANVLASSVEADVRDSVPTAAQVGELASESYYQCSIVAMLQGRGQDAQAFALTACKLAPNSLQPQVQLIKSLVFVGNSEEAGQMSFKLLVKLPVTAYVLREDSQLLANPHIQNALARRIRELGEQDVLNAVATLKEIQSTPMGQRSDAKDALAELMQEGERFLALKGEEQVRAARRVISLADKSDGRLSALENESVLTLAKDTDGYEFSISADCSRFCAQSRSPLSDSWSERKKKRWIAVWDIETGKRLYSRQLFNDGNFVHRLSPDGKKLALGKDNHIEVIDLTRTPPTRIIQSDAGKLESFVMVDGASYLLCRDGNSDRLSVFNAATGKLAAAFSLSLEEEIYVAPTGGHIATARPHYIWADALPMKEWPSLSILIRSPLDGKVVQKLIPTNNFGKPFPGYMDPVCFNAAGDKVACYCQAPDEGIDEIQLFDIRSGSRQHFPHQSEWVYACIVDRAGRPAAFPRNSEMGNLLSKAPPSFCCYGDLYVKKSNDLQLASYKTYTDLHLAWTRPQAMTLREYGRYCEVVQKWAQSRADIDANARDELFQPFSLSRNYNDEAVSLREKAIQELNAQTTKRFFKNFDKAREWLELAAKSGDEGAVKELRRAFPDSKWAMLDAGYVDTDLN